MHGIGKVPRMQSIAMHTGTKEPKLAMSLIQSSLKSKEVNLSIHISTFQTMICEFEGEGQKQELKARFATPLCQTWYSALGMWFWGSNKKFIPRVFDSLRNIPQLLPTSAILRFVTRAIALVYKIDLGLGYYCQIAHCLNKSCQLFIHISAVAEKLPLKEFSGGS